MALRKKNISRTLLKAVTRHASLTSIDKDMDLGNGLTNTGYEIAIDELRISIDNLNTLKSLVDEKQNIVHEKEAMVNDFSERMLIGVGSKFGKNSNEYNKAGGAKKGDIKHSKHSPVKKAG